MLSPWEIKGIQRNLFCLSHYPPLQTDLVRGWPVPLTFCNIALWLDGWYLHQNLIQAPLQGAEDLHLFTMLLCERRHPETGKQRTLMHERGTTVTCSLVLALLGLESFMSTVTFLLPWFLGQPRKTNNLWIQVLHCQATQKDIICPPCPGYLYQ